MTILCIIFCCLLGILISLKIYKKAYNPLLIYTFLWGSMLILFELKLIRFVSLTGNTWWIIFITYIAFIFGSLFFNSIRGIGDVGRKKNNEDIIVDYILSEDGSRLKYIIYILSFVALIGAIQHWYVLVNRLGSIAKVLIAANIVYNTRVEKEIPGVLPYTASFGIAAVFFSAIYSAYKEKLKIISLMPIIILIVKYLATFGRAGLMITLFVYVSAYILFRYYLICTGRSKPNNKVKINMIILCVVIIAGASTIKYFRKTVEDYKGTTSAIKQFEKGTVISPSIYLYLSSHVAVLNQYFEKERENARFGENTFRPIYNILSKLSITPSVSAYSRGYMIPMWSNTGTYLREIHADFGIMGLILVPFLISITCSFSWIKFFQCGNINYLTILVFFFIIIGCSFFTMISRQGDWFISFILIILINKVLWIRSKKKQLLNLDSNNKSLIAHDEKNSI